MNRWTKVITGSLVVLSLSSCGISNSYNSRDGYDRYGSRSRTIDRLNERLQRYADIIRSRTGDNGTMPPGIYAEYGYQLLKEGKKEAGMKMLHREIELYPESEAFVERIAKEFEKDEK